MALNREEKDFLTQVAASIVQANQNLTEAQKKRDDAFMVEYLKREQLFEKKCLEHELFISNQVANIHKQIRNANTANEDLARARYEVLHRNSFFGGIRHAWNIIRRKFINRDEFTYKMKKLVPSGEFDSASAHQEIAAP